MGLPCFRISCVDNPGSGLTQVFCVCFFFCSPITISGGYAVAQLVEALLYKPKGRGFDSRWCHWNFLLT